MKKDYTGEKLTVSGIIPIMIYGFTAGKTPLFIGVRGFIGAGLPRIAPVR
jgi:hypothetical protein